MGELTPCCGPHIVVGVIVRPSIRLDGIWVVLSHTGGGVAMPWCGLVCQQGADRGDALPYVRIVRRAAILLILGGVYTCVPRPGTHTICVFPPLVLSFAAKAVGGRVRGGPRLARGRGVEAGRV